MNEKDGTKGSSSKKLLTAKASGFSWVTGSWFLESDIADEFRNVCLCSSLSTTSQMPPSSITLERRQTALKPILPKLGKSHQNNLDGYIATQVRGKAKDFDCGVNCVLIMLKIQGKQHLFCCFVLDNWKQLVEKCEKRFNELCKECQRFSGSSFWNVRVCCFSWRRIS